jgi:hypothetical protein
MSEGASFTIDVSAWPVVVHRMTGGLSDAQFDAYLAEATALLSRREPHVTIFDTLQLGQVTAYIRARTQEWMRAHHEEIQTHCLGSVYVVTTPVVRFIVMASLFAKRQPTPVHVCAALDEGMAWARERLAARQ